MVEWDRNALVEQLAQHQKQELVAQVQVRSVIACSVLVGEPALSIPCEQQLDRSPCCYAIAKRKINLASAVAATAEQQQVYPLLLSVLQRTGIKALCLEAKVAAAFAWDAKVGRSCGKVSSLRHMTLARRRNNLQPFVSQLRKTNLVSLPKLSRSLRGEREIIAIPSEQVEANLGPEQ